LTGVPALFVYGTLLFPEVLYAVSGESPDGAAARLAGYERRLVRGAAYPAILPSPGGRVEGWLWRGLSAAALSRVDRFEGTIYRRQSVRVECEGVTAAADTDVVSPRAAWLVTRHAWDPERFRERHLTGYLARIRAA
jgi:gamma-glutamylcyclotransferase (GGCT)/AIG2-like uncharacterized protein YtfP